MMTHLNLLKGAETEALVEAPSSEDRLEEHPSEDPSSEDRLEEHPSEDPSSEDRLEERPSEDPSSEDQLEERPSEDPSSEDQLEERPSEDPSSEDRLEEHPSEGQGENQILVDLTVQVGLVLLVLLQKFLLQMPNLEKENCHLPVLVRGENQVLHEHLPCLRESWQKHLQWS
jgi:uncharacterized membrane protein